ncbi:Hypothetical predicted protein [Mytilus galloprovincialis]|uniref:Uncharacterized protein n=1 Tax=Mytilus galloprovincialis TaxID=29158 RepID=A0A8B6H747_MYTGA|nr:Hypothetical predicted protein [Mytilus galloprovincialis]
MPFFSYFSSFTITVILTNAWTSTQPPTPPSLWDEPCHTHIVIESTFDRTVNYTLQYGEQEYCDYMYGMYTEGWYKFSGNENVLSKPPKPGQCGSSTPVWFKGQYPTTYAEILTLEACMVVNGTDCEQSWNVSVMHCDEYNVAYIGSPQYYINTACGRYCMESNTDPCSNFTTIQYDYTRHQDYYDYMSNCDSFYSNGWYRFEGGYNLSTTPAYPGQCGSYNPIWINGSMPVEDTEMENLKACEAEYWSECAYTWSVPVMKCGTFNIMYLRQKGMCGRYCLESQNTSDITTTSSYVWDDPCHIHTVVESSFDRTANYTLAHGEYEQCDNMYGIYTEGWFKFSGNEDVLTKPPKPRQCGSATPIWFDGVYPTTYGEISTLTACLVVNDTDCHRSWNVSVMHCDSYNVAYLKPPPYDVNYGCGRYCMESNTDPCSNFTTIQYDYTRHQDYYDYMSNCDSFYSNGWYHFEGGYNLSTTPAYPGQCGSYNPIWINGSMPVEDTEMENLKLDKEWWSEWLIPGVYP